jgi:hypothetical protein
MDDDREDEPLVQFTLDAQTVAHYARRAEAAGEFDTGTVVTVVPVSGTEGGSAPREACPRIRLPAPSRCSLLYTSRTAPALYSAPTLNGVYDGADAGARADSNAPAAAADTGLVASTCEGAGRGPYTCPLLLCLAG